MEHLLNGIIALFMSYDDYNVKNKVKLTAIDTKGGKNFPKGILDSNFA